MKKQRQRLLYVKEVIREDSCNSEEFELLEQELDFFSTHTAKWRVVKKKV